MGKTERILASLVLLLVPAFDLPVAAQQATGRTERYGEALSWLERNAGDPQSGAMLLQLVENAPSIRVLRESLDRYAATVADSTELARIRLSAGRLLESANRLAEARSQYEGALELDTRLWEAALRATALDVELGDYTDAVLRAGTVIQGAPRREQQREAALHRARALWLAGEPLRGLRHARDLAGLSDSAEPAVLARTIEPSALLLAVEIAVAVDRRDLADEAYAILTGVFGAHPETALARSILEPAAAGTTIAQLPSPGRLLGLDPGFDGGGAPRAENESRGETQSDAAAPDEGVVGEAAVPDAGPATSRTADPELVYGIQTGSFRDPDNARFMAEDIERMGFQSEVREVTASGSTFYRVVVPLVDGATVESAQDTIVALKERGVEGFLLFR